MFFKKKRVEESKTKDVAPVEEKPRDAIEEWGANGKAVVTGYVLKGCRMWNFNHPEDVISESELEKLLLGMKMAFSSTPPEKAVALYEDHISREGKQL